MKSMVLENIKYMITDITYPYTYDLADLQKIIYVIMKRIMDYSISNSIDPDLLFAKISNNSKTLPIEFLLKFMINEVYKSFVKFELEIFSKYVDYERNNILYKEDIDFKVIVFVKTLLAENELKIGNGLLETKTEVFLN
jgi:hypothetical protein